jgi:hypothetical protein
MRDRDGWTDGDLVAKRAAFRALSPAERVQMIREGLALARSVAANEDRFYWGIGDVFSDLVTDEDEDGDSLCQAVAELSTMFEALAGRVWLAADADLTLLDDAGLAEVERRLVALEQGDDPASSAAAATVGGEL